MRNIRVNHILPPIMNVDTSDGSSREKVGVQADIYFRIAKVLGEAIGHHPVNKFHWNFHSGIYTTNSGVSTIVVEFPVTFFYRDISVK